MELQQKITSYIWSQRETIRFLRSAINIGGVQRVNGDALVAARNSGKGSDPIAFTYLLASIHSENKLDYIYKKNLLYKKNNNNNPYYQSRGFEKL